MSIYGRVKSIRQGKFTGLMAETSTTAGYYRLRARVLLPLTEIEGKTPRQVWQLFDDKVDAERRSLVQRDSLSYAPPSHSDRRPWRPLVGYLQKQ